LKVHEIPSIGKKQNSWHTKYCHKALHSHRFGTENPEKLCEAQSLFRNVARWSRVVQTKFSQYAHPETFDAARVAASWFGQRGVSAI
jgi:hypothetical protein